MAYVIFGGTGHIGNNLVRMLIENNEDVVLVVRSVNEAIKNLKAKIIIGDIFDESLLNMAINKDDIVIHAIGLIDIKNKLKEETFKINYESTKKIFEIALNVCAKHFIYISSVDAIYKGDLPKEKAIDEPSIMYPEKFKENYPKTKALATNYILNEMKSNHEMTISIVYPSAVIGINDFKPSLIGKVIKDVIDGKTEFGINGGYNFIDVVDLARGIIDISKQKENDSYILSGHDVTVSELYKLINDALGKEGKVHKVPYFLVLLAIPFVPYLSKFSLKTLRENHNYSSLNAQSKIGFRNTPIEETIKNTVEWFIKHSKGENLEI